MLNKFKNLNLEGVSSLSNFEKTKEIFGNSNLSKQEMKGIKGGGCTLTIDYGEDCSQSVTTYHSDISGVKLELRNAKNMKGYSYNCDKNIQY